tara:strand:- start:3998 stop:5164 length:1167 start_codon:yes stop_codon:yes gene_type:complete
MTLKIVVDENIPLAEAFFSPLAKVVRLPGRTLTAADVRDADALIVRSVTSVNEALLAGSKVKFVGTCTIGIDHLDIAYFKRQGIAYSSAPGCNANSVVEYIFSAFSALNVDWRGKSVGIVGCGNVGGHLYRRLLEFGVNCRCYDPFLSHADNVDLCSLDEVLANDIVCLHTPLTLSGPHPTRHLIGTAQLQQLTSGALLLNAGRGDVIDNQALLSFMQQRQDVQVVLDVWEGEPNINTSLLRLVDLASPHIAGYSFDGKVAGTEMIYQALCTHFGIEVTMCAADLVAADLTPLELSAATDFELMRQAVLAAYDIRGDDARMREQLQNLPVNQLRQGFDALRKNYPKRREFNCFSTVAKTHIEKKSLNNVLATLGFCTGFETSKTGVNT